MTRTLLLMAALLASSSLAAAQEPEQPQSRAHMEACTEWKPEGGHIGTRNDCNRPVSIKFLAYGGTQVMEADIPPGGWFDSGIPEGLVEGFIFTVCPVGYTPSVGLSMKDKTQIMESLYNCLPVVRPGV
jgi:hypothetical protein